MDRRTFNKLMAMMAATAVAGGRTISLGQEAGGSAPQPAVLSPELTWAKAPCRFCGTGCHVMVGVGEGRVRAIMGDQKAEVNKGLLCVKGYHVGAILYGEDRLTRPLLRVNGQLQPIEWPEAIKIVADKIEAAPGRFALYGSGQWTIPEGYIAQKFMKGGLANNHIDPNARLCMASAVTGFLSTYGVDEPAGCYDDLDKCDVLIMWGNNPAEMHPVLFSRVIDRRSRGETVTLIDIGTRRTRTTEHCDEYLNFKPQTDLAIANGIAHLLIKNDTYDKSFVETYCAFKADSDPAELHGRPISFEEYKQFLEPYTPAYVAELSGVSVEKLHLLADLFGRRDIRITSLWCMGMNQHTQGTAINTLVHGIHLLSGHFGRPGDAPTSLTGQPSACGTVREVGTLSHGLPGGRVVTEESHRRDAEALWNVEAGRINPKPGHHTIEMWRRFCTAAAEGGDIDTIWVQVTNPGQTLPNRKALFTAKSSLPEKFLIVSDVYPTATTELADLVLPAAMWVEKNGVFGNSERRTQQWFKMVDPPGEARPDAWMMLAVARELFDRGHPSMRDKDGEFLFAMRGADGAVVPAWDWDHFYDMNVDKHVFEEYRQFTRMKHKDLAPYDAYVEARGLRWPVVEQPDGTWRETRYRFAGFDDPYVEKGKEIQFYHSPTHDGRAQVWFRPYVPPPESPDDDYPFWLCTGRVLEHWHSGTMTMRIPQLRRAMPGAYVEVNAEDAARAGIHDGETVIVETRRGSIELSVWIDGRGSSPPGTVFVPFFDEKKPINDLTLEAFDLFSKQPDYKKCAARIRKMPPAAATA